MLAKTFLIMIAVSFVSAVSTGNLDRMSSEFTTSLSDAVSLCISLLGIMCFWSGFMRVLRDSGALKHLSRLLKPIIRRIYGKRGLDEEMLDNLAASVTANFLGLGNAALPLGIQVMKSMERKNSIKGTASDSMIMFVVLNTVPFQLIPTTLITLRSKYGCENPFDVVPLIWLCSVIIIVFAIAVCKILSILFSEKVRRRL